MGKTILFSPVGNTDPISNSKDGSMLHICRNYQPDIIYLYLSKEMIELSNEDDRYRYCIKKLYQKIGKNVDIIEIKKENLCEVQEYDYFYEEFKEEIKKIKNQMNDDDELLVNIASGTPAMKSALLVLAALADYSFKPIQVSTPLKKGNNKRPEFNVEKSWEEDKDNEDSYENRCSASKCKNLNALIKIEIIRELIANYDYDAALIIAREIKDKISDKALDLIEIASERVKLNLGNIESRVTKYEEDKKIIPIKRRNKEIFEYALSLEIKYLKGELADYIRALTPLVADLMELILEEQCEIKIDDYCKRDFRNVRKFDMGKFNNTQIEQILKKEFPNGLNNSFVGTAQMVPIIKAKSNDSQLKQRVADMREIEEKIRNTAAHEIVSVTEARIKNKTGKTPKEIYELIKYLVVKAGVRAKTEDWNSYRYMNELIAKELEL